MHFFVVDGTDDTAKYMAESAVEKGTVLKDKDERCIDFQIINFTRLEGGRHISYTSTTDNAVKLFI